MDMRKGVKEYDYTVGRLDYDSEGLLLLTNDGDLAARLMHPSQLIAKTEASNVHALGSAVTRQRLRQFAAH